MTNRKKSLKFAQIIRKFMFKTGMQLRDKRQIFFNLNVLKKKIEKQGHFVERKNT